MTADSQFEAADPTVLSDADVELLSGLSAPTLRAFAAGFGRRRWQRRRS